MRFLLGTVEDVRGPVGSVLAGTVITDRLGMFGMSFGGAAAGAFCASEPRCVGGVSLDGGQWGPWFGDHYRRPFLSMGQDLDSWNDFFFAGGGRDYHRVKVAGAYHGDFTDGFQSTPLTRFAGVLGPIGGKRSTEILRAYVTAFFDRYLRDLPAPLLEGPSPFPEVEHTRDPLGMDRRDSPPTEADVP
jgi:pimeloyl-ACP methyl ester carboxylesterase